MLNARILLLEFRPLKEPELGEKGIGHKKRPRKTSAFHDHNV
jgi:hypothetical protein